MPRLLILCLAVACLLLTACGEDEAAPSGGAASAEKEPVATPTPTAAAAAACQKVEAPGPKPEGRLSKPSLELDRAKRYVATVRTSCGAFEITLDPRRAPRTGGSFVSLARKKFYDDGTFHRIVPNFVIQGGDPMGTGAGGPGYSVVEAPPPDLEYEPGVVAMAKTETEAPGTSGSQFYVVTGSDASQLPPEYALLGKVNKGLDVVQRIGEVPTEGEGQPVDPVVIESIRLREG